MKRWKDAEVISNYMGDKLDRAWWEAVKAGKADPWKNMMDNDINGQTSILKHAKDVNTGKTVLVPVDYGK